jgi:uncharacterized protein YrrD
MLIEAKKLISLPVASMEDGEKIGEITKIIVDKNSASILGFLVKSGGLLSPKLALSIVDITEWDPNGIVTNSMDNLVPPDEIVRLNDVLKSNFDIFGTKAKTESGKNLGTVDNFLIDTETGTIAKYYLKDIINGERIFSADKVIKIDKAIIFSDDVAVVPPGAQNAIA